MKTYFGFIFMTWALLAVAANETLFPKGELFLPSRDDIPEFLRYVNQKTFPNLQEIQILQSQKEQLSRENIRLWRGNAKLYHDNKKLLKENSKIAEWNDRLRRENLSKPNRPTVHSGNSIKQQNLRTKQKPIQKPIQKPTLYPPLKDVILQHPSVKSSREKIMNITKSIFTRLFNFGKKLFGRQRKKDKKEE